jgi:hypothetical protein
MLGEKDLIFFGAVILAGHWGADPDSAVVNSIKIYEKVFGHVSDDNLRDKYSIEK